MIQVNAESLEQRIEQLGRKVLDGQALSRDEARSLTAVRGQDRYELFYWANKIRRRFIGDRVTFCSIVAGKAGACKEDCGFCSQSKHHGTGLKPSKMTAEQMIAASTDSLDHGASSFGIVNSGTGPTDKELEWMRPVFEKLASEGKMRPCATLGELSPEQAQKLRSMGVQRINHNLETSRRNFGNVVSTHTYEDRVRTLRLAKQAGLSLCSGGIFGMGEDWEDRLDMAFELRDLEVDVVPINFLKRIDGTPIAKKVDSDLTPMEALSIVSIFRFILPTQELKIAGGREEILRDMQSWMFFAGANSFLIGNYLTTLGRSPSDDHRMLRDLGLSYVTYDEVEHEAKDDDLPSPQAPRSLVGPRVTSQNTVSLPVMNG